MKGRTILLTQGILVQAEGVLGQKKMLLPFTEGTPKGEMQPSSLCEIIQLVARRTSFKLCTVYELQYKHHLKVGNNNPPISISVPDVPVKSINATFAK